jgi:hypothetical protein
MKVELGMICGMMTGIVRPRTGPMITGSMAPQAMALEQVPQVSPTAPTAERNEQVPQSAIPTQSAASPTEVLDPEVLRSHHRPRSEPTVAISEQAATGPHDAGPAKIDPRDLEPTHSSIVGPPISDPGPWGSTPAGEATLSRILAPTSEEPPRRRGLIAAIAAAASFAILAGGGTAWFLVSDGWKDDDAVVRAVEPRPAASPGLVEDAPVVEGPSLVPVAPSPIAVGEAAPREAASADAKAAPMPSEPTPTEAAPVEVATEVAPTEVAPPAKATPATTPKRPGAARPTTPPKPEPTPAGPPVGVHFRLEGGIDYAEVKLAGNEFKIDKRLQSRVPSGKHSVKYRVRDGEWKKGSVVLGASGEWKIWVGPNGVRTEKL